MRPPQAAVGAAVCMLSVWWHRGATRCPVLVCAQLELAQ